MKTSQTGACSRLMCMSRSILSEFKHKQVFESFAPPKTFPNMTEGPPRTGCSNLLGPPPSFEHGALIFRGPVVSPDPGPNHSRNSKIHPKLSVQNFERGPGRFEHSAGHFSGGLTFVQAWRRCFSSFSCEGRRRTVSAVSAAFLVKAGAVSSRRKSPSLRRCCCWW